MLYKEKRFGGIKKDLRAVVKRGVALVLAFTLAFSLLVRVVATEGESVSGEESEQDDRDVAIGRMITGFENFEERIDLSDLNILPDRLGELFAAATKNSPYLFYVGNNLSYTNIKGGGVVSVLPKYLYSKDEAIEMVSYCREEIAKLASLAQYGESELERVLILHDLICKKFSYDLSLESNNLYTFLKTGSGTCQGYTWTYMAALREMGIECEYVASDTIVHIWLRVRIDGEWYYSDVTWDDPPQNEGTGKQSRAHFLFSDEKADADGYSDRYSASKNECQSGKYDGDDLSDVISFCLQEGDIDHDGEVGLLDLLRLRMYLEKGERDGYICPICSDLDGNLSLEGDDVEPLRRMMIASP